MIQPARLTQQPQHVLPVDWSNPITRALAMSVVPGLHRAFDLVAQQHPTVTGTKVAAIAGGLAASFGAATGVSNSDKITTGFSSPIGLSGRTYQVVLRRNGSGGGGLGRVFDKTTSSTGQFLCWYASTNRMMYGFYAGTGAERNVNIPATNVSAATGRDVELWVQHAYDGENSYISAWADGALVLDRAVYPGVLRDSSAPLVIGNRGSDNARCWDGSISLFNTWERLLDPVEMEAQRTAPWQMLRAPRRLVGAAPAAVPLQLAGRDGSQANVGSAGSITQTQETAGAGGAQQNAGSVGMLGQVQNLGGADATQLNVTDVGQIGQVLTLAGADGVQQNAAGSGEITSEAPGLLVGVEGNQLNSGSVGAIGQVQVLAGADGGQHNAGAAGAVGQVQNLIANHGDQFNDGSVGAITIAPPESLEGAEGQQANVGDTCAITQSAVLAGADGAQHNTGTVGALVRIGLAIIYTDPGELRIYAAVGECRIWTAAGEQRILTLH
ncbi:hypothetical protein QPK31_02720 [Massilia sp. YIM B02769]|nr:hypothetical protein [Massilia sp. YIM B02769]